MFRGYRENGKFSKILSRIYLEEFIDPFQSFTKCFYYLLLDSLMIVTNEGSIACKSFK